MPATATAFFEYSQYAFASYGIGLVEGPAIDNLERLSGPDMMSRSQAEAFAQGKVVVAHMPNDASGFSATLFRDQAGRYVLAIRGTEEIPDGVADGRIISQGFEKAQTIALANWFRRLVAPTSEQVPQYREVEPSYDLSGNVVDPGGVRVGGAAAGLNRLPANTKLTIAGHSLGGYLSIVFTSLFPDNVEEIYTYNRLGYRDSPAFQTFMQALGGTGQVMPGVSFHLMADASLDGAVAVGNSPGTERRIFSELGIAPVHNHSIRTLSESVALYSLFGAIDPSMSAASFSRVAEALSDTASDTIERGVESLYKLFTSNSITIAADDRQALYLRYGELREVIAGFGIAGLTLADLTSNPNAAGSLAQGEIAYRYALRELNPYAVLGVGYSQQGDLALFDPSTDTGLTEKWLEARAEALSAKIMRNRGDVAFARVDDKITDTQFGNVLQRTLAFGKDGIDSLSGGIVGDALFGGAGGDTISGGLGNDYIEGNDGWDTIDGGWGDDEIYGAEGRDTISGGSDTDHLYGGADDDTIDGGSGDDVIYGDKKDDQNNTQVTGDDTIDGGSGIDRIWGSGGVDTVRGGADNDQIEGNAGNDKLYGDGGSDSIKGGLGENLIVGGEGADSLLEGGDEKDTIYGDEESINGTAIGEADVIRGGNGDDFLYGGGGADTILGGEGKDEIVGGHGNDIALFGGAGDDTIYGGRKERDDKQDQGLDKLFGEAGKDELFGGNGIDFLFGGADEDKLHGEGGNDKLEGGTGLDTYYYTPNDGRDIIKDEGNEGRILWGEDEIALFGGKNSGPGDLVYYDNPDDWRFKYEASSDPDEGRFDVIITSRQGGLLEVRDLLLTEGNGLGLRFEDGKDEPNDLPPAPPVAGVPPPRRFDPLVLDLDGLGIATLGLNAELHFDHEGDGFAERTGWVSAGDGVLILDANADGALTNGQELFGDFTRLAGGQLALNGFQALSAYDQNRDGRIDALDPVWTSLSVGSFDADEETGEALLADPTTGLTLTSLDALGIGSLSLASAIVNTTDLQGNTKTRTSTFTLTGGTTAELAEYRFARDATLTRPVDAPVLSEETRALPGLAGGAQVLNLREALELDASGEGYLGKPSGYLRGKLDAFTSEADAGAYYARFEGLFNAWAGLEAIPAGEMRGEIGARQVAALEKFYGLSLSATPHHFQSLAWEKNYRDLTERFYGELLQQTHFRSHYEAMILVPRTGTTPYGNLMPLVPMFEAEIAADEAQGTARLHEFARSLRGREVLEDTSYFAFRERFILNPDGQVNEDKAFAFDTAGTPLRAGTTDFSEAVRAAPGQGLGSAYGEDVLYGDGASSGLGGGLHDNLLYGGAGADDLSGLQGADILDGGPGDDVLRGNVGDDFYLFRPGSGRDRIQELDGIDTVFFGGGLTRADVRVAAGDWNSLRFELPATGDVLSFEGNWWVPGSLERFAFSDGTLFTLQDLLVPTEAADLLVGSPGADTIDALGGDDVVSGFAGNDHLIGGEGVDELDGGEGADILDGGAGNDHIIAGPGDDVIDAGAGDDRVDLGTAFDSGYWSANGGGNDTYRFGFGDGADTILDDSGFDTVLFKPGVTTGDVSLTNDGNNLVIALAGGADRVTVVNHFAAGIGFTTPSALERVQFADGTVLDAAELTNVTVAGTPDADTLQGYTAAKNLILGLEGDDELFGQSRADRLEGGEGDDELSGRGGDDRLIGGGGNDRLFGETEPLFLTAFFEPMEGGNDVLEGGEGDDLLYGGHGSDVYDGGAGDDQYIEVKQPFTYSLGADVFLFGRGAGHDTVIANESDYRYWYWLPGRVAGQEIVDDVVRLGPDIAPEDVTVFAEMSEDATGRHANVRLQVAGDPNSSLTIRDFLGGANFLEHLWSSVRRIEFGDGTVWNREEVLDRLTWQGTPDADVINAGQLRDRVFGEGGNDNLYGRAGDDFIDGGEGDDFIDGGAGSDTLFGGEGSDSIHTGGHGNDTIDGGAGDDRIGHWRVDRPEAFFFNAPPRLEGDVTIVFGPGSGNDRAFLPNTRPGSNDAIEVTAAPEDVKLVRLGGDLVLTLPGTGETLTVQHWFDGAAYRVENIRFAGGAAWDADRILAEVLIGTEDGEQLAGYDSDDLIEGREGNDVLHGGGGADRLAGGTGDDLLSGDGGADVYAYARGDGNDTIVASGGEDAIEFGAGILPGDLLVRNRGGNMAIAFGSGEQITAIGQFSGFGVNLAEVRFDDGTVWDEDMLRERALAGTPGDDVIEGFDTDDELAGGGGFDELNGGGGDDFYLFESGILLLSDPDGFDTLSFGALTPDDVDFSLSNGELFIEVLATGDEAEIADFADDFGPTGNIDEFQFGDGTTVLSAFQVFTLIGAGDAEVIFGTDFDDSLEGSEGSTIVFAGDGDDIVDGEGGADELHGEAGADLLRGGRGDDLLDGGEGEDDLRGGDGDDELDGGGGDDQLDGGEGDDELYGNDGDDRLDGGEGRDRIEGEGGNDTIVVGRRGDLDDVIGREADDDVDATIREGFEEAYEQAREELSDIEDLEDDETFESSFWSSQSDGGAAADIPFDLLQPLFELSDGVSAEFARYALLNLDDWLRSIPRENELEGGPVYAELESQARFQMRQARVLDDEETYSTSYWEELFGPHDIPDEILDPLLALGDGVPARQAERAFATFLGWLFGARDLEYEIVESSAPLYGTALVELYNIDPTDTVYYNDYWDNVDLFRFDAPEELSDAVQAMGQGEGVAVATALDTLRRLEDWLLQREAGGSGEEDAVEFGDGIELEDLEIATLTDEDTGNVTELAIGIRGTNDGIVISENGHDEGNSTSVADLSVRTFRLEDGTELTLDEILDMADGTIGFQEGTEDADTLRGSAAEDDIQGEDGDDILLGRGNDDELRGQSGSDILGAGAGDDEAHGGPGDDVIAGEKGDDALRGGPGNDAYLFNYGDGEDSIDTAFDEGEIDTLSFGVDITPDMVSAFVGIDETLTLLVEEGDGGSVSMESPLQRVQFVDENGAVRIFDLAGLMASRSAELATSSINLFEDAGAFELTGSEVPAGGGIAVAYAQTGDLFADPFYAENEPSDEGDQLAGGAGDDEIDAGEGDDVVSGGGGDDVLIGGEGDDVLSGGAGEDFLEAGPGDDIARGGEGADTYFFERGDGTLAIHDNGDNTLELGGDIEFQELRLSHSGGFLEIRFASEGDLVRLAGFEPTDLFDETVISAFYFESEDEEYDFETLLERGFTIDGTDQADSLDGTAIHDAITAGDGADFLAGGAGDDVLDGGGGGDTYFFKQGDGFDEIVDRESSLEANTVEFGFGIDPQSLSVYFAAGDLFLEYGSGTLFARDVDLGDPAQAIPFETIRFADGSTLSLVDLLNAGIEIEGSDSDDGLVGGTGGDHLFGLQGDDLLSGGGGGDFYYVEPGSGTDTIDDVSVPSEENTLVILHSDATAADLSLVYDAAAGTLDVRLADETVKLAGFDPADPFGVRAIDFVQFASGERLTYAELLALGIEIFGTEGVDVLQGTDARDLIYALDGDDFIPASQGGDTVDGGVGDDVYSYRRGDGVLTIVDEISTTPQNALLFGPGIALADLRNNLRFEAPAGGFPGALVIDLGGEDRVRILGFDPTDAEGGAHAIDTFAFADGTAVGYRDLVRNTFIVQGDTLDDALTGTNIGDRLYGFEGNDELRSGDGPDALTGGTGDDLLEGGAGSDEYVFNRGDGSDRIRDSAEFDDNFITVGAGITAADLSLTFDGADLRIVYGAGDEVTVEDFDRAAPVIRSLRFADGSTLDIGAALNAAPFAVAALEDQIALEDSAFAYAISVGAFDDADGGPLSLSAMLADGYALPAWLAFDPLTGTFSGTAGNGDVGALTIRVLATDPYGGEAAQEFDLTVVNTNDAPVVANAVADQAATEDEAFSVTLPANQFADADLGDTLTVSLTLANGDALPGWLSYDPASRVLNGTPGNEHVGTLEIVATATDAQGATTTDDFGLTITNVNDAPLVATVIANQAATEDAAFSFTLPAGTFADADTGDALTTFATLANGDPLPLWLSYDPGTLTFSGTPANEDVGTLSVSVTVVDTFGASVAESFDLAVTNTNDAPLLAAPLADAFVIEDDAFSFTVSLDAFADPDLGDTLIFSTDALPAWLNFDPGTGTFSGLATNDEVGAHLVQVVATDLSGATGTGLFALIVLNVNDAPVAGDDTATVREDVLTAISGNLTDNDEDVDQQVDPTALLVVSPTGDVQGGYGTLALSADGTYAYNLDNDAVQLLREDQTVFDSFEYQLSDGIVTTAATLTVIVVGTNDAPVTTADAASLGEDVASVFGNVLTNDNDVDAGTTLIVANADSHLLTYGTLHLAANGAYAFELNAAAQTLRGGEQVEQSFTYAALDGLASADGTLTISVSGVNDAPLLAAPIADQNAAAGTAFSFSFAAGTFTDVDAGDSLSYAASLADGSALPSWLSFDAVTRTFAGTPPGSSGGGMGGGDDCGCGTGGGTAPEALDLRVTATDTAGASAQDTFVLNIAGGGGGSGIVPIVGTDRDDVLNGTGANDVIDGRKGYDRMSGGAGDDVYYVDRTGSKVDLVTEKAGAGYDTVYSSANYTLGSNLEELHLIGDDDLEGKGNSLANMLIGNGGDNKLYGEAGNDLLLDDAGRDRLDGGAGDDVMDGGAGDDTLLGGAGNDLYVHARGGDDDVVMDSGGNDAIRFGEGIAAADVTVRRNGGDLTLKLSGGNGSVTVKDWFSSSAKRVEQVQFADGTVWNEAAIRARVTSGGSSGGHGDGHDHHDDDRGGGYGGSNDGGGGRRGNGHDNDGDGWDGHHGGRHDHKDHHGGDGDGGSDAHLDSTGDAIAQRLKRNPNYDFTALAQYLQRNGGGGYGAMTPQQIAQRWLQVQNCVGSLAQADDDCSSGNGGIHHGGGYGDDDERSRCGWGYSGSTGRNGGCGGMDTFSGLGEGFRRL